MRITTLTCFMVLALVAHRARAQSQPPPQTPETIDAGKGPIAGTTRFIGLGGAFVAIAEDNQGVAVNPASSAVRLPYHWTAFDYGFGVDFSIGAWLPKNDFYNQSGSGNGTGNSTALFGSVAADVYYRHFGLGVAAEAQHNAATRQDQAQGISSSLAANFGLVHASVAYGFFDGQLLLGAGPRIVGLSFNRHGSSVLSSAGMGYEAGFIVKPTSTSYRVGVAVKSPINAKLPTDPGAPTNTVHVPWQVAMGLAYQFGPPPLNPSLVVARDIAKAKIGGHEPTDAEVKVEEDALFAAYETRERWYLLVSAELSLIQGGGDRSGGFYQYGSDTGQATFAGAIVSPRLGIESEVWPHVLRLRAGSYYEQPLVDGAQFRVHGTGGLDVRLFRWNVFGLIGRFDVWQLSLAADAARSYLNTAFSIGFWH